MKSVYGSGNPMYDMYILWVVCYVAHFNIKTHRNKQKDGKKTISNDFVSTVAVFSQLLVLKDVI